MGSKLTIPLRNRKQYKCLLTTYWVNMKCLRIFRIEVWISDWGAGSVGKAPLYMNVGTRVWIPKNLNKKARYGRAYL